jgi:transcriptional regulator with XRE-family HTH domain
LSVANDTATKLLARVKELREQHGLSQEAFAEKAGLGYKYYQHIEAGRRRDVRISTVHKLAKACGVEAWELLQFDTPVQLLGVGPAEPYGPGAAPTAKPRARATAKVKAGAKS